MIVHLLSNLVVHWMQWGGLFIEDVGDLVEHQTSGFKSGNAHNAPCALQDHSVQYTVHLTKLTVQYY